MERERKCFRDRLVTDQGEVGQMKDKKGRQDTVSWRECDLTPGDCMQMASFTGRQKADLYKESFLILKSRNRPTE